MNFRELLEAATFKKGTVVAVWYSNTYNPKIKVMSAKEAKEFYSEKEGFTPKDIEALNKLKTADVWKSEDLGLMITVA